MSKGRFRFLPRWVREFPADLSTTILFVLLTDIVVLAPVVKETPLRVIFGLPLILFFPGYALISALFPEDGDALREPQAPIETKRTYFSGIDGLERFALSVGLSIAIVPLIGLVLNFTPWGIRLLPVLLSVSGFTIIAALIGAGRRWEIRPEERFRVPYQEWVATVSSELFDPESRTDAALNLLLVVSIVLAASSVTYAVTVPNQGESFTEFYLLSEEPDGDLVADDYPTQFADGQSQPLVIGIENHEHETVEYTIIIELQRVQSANDSIRVSETTELTRIPARLSNNETWQERVQIQPTMPGNRLRLVFLLYRDEVPNSPSVDNSYRELHLWINVTDPVS